LQPHSAYGPTGEAEPFAEDLLDDLLAALSLPGRMRKPITDREVLTKRDEALARPRAARAARAE